MYHLLIFLPLAVLIALAVTTKKMTTSMVTATICAMVILYKEKFISGFIDTAYDVLSNSSFQLVFLILIGFGAFITLLQKSGALHGFCNLIGKYARGQKGSMIFACLMSFVMFVDEYLNALTVTFSMKNVTDMNNVPREHLAFQTHGMACCLCIVIPFTSWTAFTVGLISDEGLGFLDYLKAIPYMFFPLMMVLVCILLTTGLFPKLGEIRRAYNRVNEGGPSLLLHDNEESIIDMPEMEDVETTSAINALLPIAILVAGVLIFDNNLLAGLLLALISQFIIYTAKRIMTFTEFFETFFEGAKSMATMSMIIGFGFMLSRANDELGMYGLVTAVIDANVPDFILPVLAFLIVGTLTFAVGSCWVIMTILIPILVPVALTAGISGAMIIGAIMSGIALGYSLCFYADTLFMTSAGTGVSNMTIIRSTIPYALGIAAVSCIGFTICGVTAV